MTFEEFLTNCVGHGGNWAAMLISGIKRVLPEVYATMDDNKSYNTFELLELIEANGVIMED